MSVKYYYEWLIDDTGIYVSDETLKKYGERLSTTYRVYTFWKYNMWLQNLHGEGYLMIELQPDGTYSITPFADSTPTTGKLVNLGDATLYGLTIIDDFVEFKALQVLNPKPVKQQATIMQQVNAEQTVTSDVNSTQTPVNKMFLVILFIVVLIVAALAYVGYIEFNKPADESEIAIRI